MKPSLPLLLLTLTPSIPALALPRSEVAETADGKVVVGDGAIAAVAQAEKAGIAETNDGKVILSPRKKPLDAPVMPSSPEVDLDLDPRSEVKPKIDMKHPPKNNHGVYPLIEEDEYGRLVGFKVVWNGDEHGNGWLENHMMVLVDNEWIDTGFLLDPSGGVTGQVDPQAASLQKKSGVEVAETPSGSVNVQGIVSAIANGHAAETDDGEVLVGSVGGTPVIDALEPITRTRSYDPTIWTGGSPGGAKAKARSLDEVLNNEFGLPRPKPRPHMSTITRGGGRFERAEPTQMVGVGVGYQHVPPPHGPVPTRRSGGLGMGMGMEARINGDGGGDGGEESETFDQPFQHAESDGRGGWVLVIAKDELGRYVGVEGKRKLDAEGKGVVTDRGEEVWVDHMMLMDTGVWYDTGYELDKEGWITGQVVVGVEDGGVPEGVKGVRIVEGGRPVKGMEG